MATAFCAPTFSSTWTQYVLTDLPNPDHMVCVPVIELLALCGHHRPPQDCGSCQPLG